MPDDYINLVPTILLEYKWLQYRARLVAVVLTFNAVLLLLLQPPNSIAISKPCNIYSAYPLSLIHI